MHSAPSVSNIGHSCKLLEVSVKLHRDGLTNMNFRVIKRGNTFITYRRPRNPFFDENSDLDWAKESDDEEPDLEGAVGAPDVGDNAASFCSTRLKLTFFLRLGAKPFQTENSK